MLVDITIKKTIDISKYDFLLDTILLKNKMKTNSVRRECQCPGVYAFFNMEFCLYVWKSANNVCSRILQHLRHGLNNSTFPETNKIIIWLCSKFDAQLLEHVIIRNLQPLYNSLL